MIVNNSIEVVLPLPIDKTFNYAVNKNEFINISHGSRVVVSFGKKKLYTAIVINKFTNKNYEYELKEIEFIVDDKPCINQYQIEFYNWISSYYMCPIGKVYETALPKLLLIKSETIIDVISDDNTNKLSNKANDLYQSISNFKEISVIDLVKLHGRDTMKLVNELVLNDFVKIREEIFENYKPRTKIFYELNFEILESELTITDLRSENQKKIAEFFLSKKRKFIESQNNLMQTFNISVSILNSLVKKNILIKKKISVDRFDYSKIGKNIQIKLTEDQENTLSEINHEFKKNNVVLFKGVTSSGKTEIYVELIKQVLKKKLNVLFLVPEIALTTQLVSRLEKYFPNNLHVYHSGINPNLRYEIWNDLKSNVEPRVVLGARSSIFLPFTNIGLIIVDEENEVSYKQFKSSPLYNARDLAVYLSKTMNSRCILASATPSLESFHNSEINKYSLVQLNKRYGNFESPELIFDDLSSDSSLLLSQMMIGEIKKELENNKQIIIFRNRRGYSTYVQCTACLNVDQCPNCDVSLTFHINKKLLKCHYCGYSKDESITCSKCGLQALEKKGVGTQLIEEKISSFFPNIKVARLDYDTTRKKSSFKDIISRFEDNEFQILVGTQMVTKGLDFKNVSLVCVIESDFLLNYPDFRSHERYFQLIKQVSGRAGRSGSRGRVIIQTKNINHYVNRRIIENDDINFYKNEINQREEFNYPPFSRLIKINLKSKKNEILFDSANWLADSLRNISNIEVLGPEYPLISRINNFFIVNILLKLESKSNIPHQKKLIEKVLSKFNKYPEFRSVKILIDVDPYN
ncbi:MAG: primosomal protein N' [Flavobacteriaceae bacterium TMED238]|nr:primosomal protein N' [Flavobacteriales bacterium]RPG62935.1 MAG: primosomal protein N' [Flavobacteriaceae bacterium TMED238]